MRNYPPFLLWAAVIGTILCAGCTGNLTAPDVSTTELQIHAGAPVYVQYGTGDCFARKEMPGDTVLRFASIRCTMNYAYFNKTSNDTGNEVLQVDLVRDGKVIKSYSTVNGSVGFDKINEFLAQSAKDPGLVRDVPVMVKIVTEGEWGGTIDDKYGGLYETRTGPATLTLNQPVLPVKACFSTPGDSVPSALAVELYQGETLLNRSDVRSASGDTCVTYP
jgi:hypothetical protein